MVVAADITHGHGPSNKMCPQLQLKKTNVRKVVLATNITAKGIIHAVYY